MPPSGGLTSRLLSLTHSPGSWKSKVKVPAGSVPAEGPLSNGQMAAFSLCLHVAERGGMGRERERDRQRQRETESSLIPSGRSSFRPHPKLVAPMAPPATSVTLRVGASTYKLEGTHAVHSTGHDVAGTVGHQAGPWASTVPRPTHAPCAPHCDLAVHAALTLTVLTNKTPEPGQRPSKAQPAPLLTSKSQVNKPFVPQPIYIKARLSSERERSHL